MDDIKSRLSSSGTTSSQSFFWTHTIPHTLFITIMSLTKTISITEAKPLQFTAEQVAEHNSRKDNWIIVHGQVIDISQYIDDHPGGSDILHEVAGQDATEAFDNAGHSEDTLEIMAEFCVGQLQGYKKPTPKRTIPVVTRQPVTAPPSKGSSSSLSKAATAAAITSLAALSAAYFSHNLPLNQAQKAALKQLFSRLPHLPVGSTHGFPAGFLAASTLSILATAYTAKLLLGKITHIEHGFTRFPSHKASSKRPPPLNSGPFLHPKDFQPLPLIRKDELGPSLYRLVFALPTPQTVLGLPTGQHVAIKAVVDGKPVQRSYTPVSNDSDLGVLELVIRSYPEGLLTGKYLAHLTPGKDSVLFRGPKGAMHYHRGLAKRIGMVAGGTGITPMYQVIRAICEDPEDTTQVSLVYANRTEGDIVLRKELEEFARRCPEKLRLWYMVDLAPEHGEWAYGTGHVTKEVLEDTMPTPGEDAKVFLCGPPGMVNAAKGILKGMGYELPGAVGKMEDQVFCF
ncbi:hypothetical protein QBC35DRAFT_506802 [Podospora australis]|uniref:Cytochrome-b5 reductase n=1 Tax=Podospora australis TaxID=1536484 RepID=A0AAN6WLC2_9PEZI|nr:hypothetical protein QBC35DRAFT_506802 [Podospora australis]